MTFRHVEVGRVTADFGGDRSKERIFKRDPSAIREVRSFLSELLGNTPFAEDAILLVSEIATNAVRYGAGRDITVCVTIGKEIRVEVGDDSPELPVPLNPEGVHGRGLYILDAIASSWGAQPRNGGKVVWFTVPAE